MCDNLCLNSKADILSPPQFHQLLLNLGTTDSLLKAKTVINMVKYHFIICVLTHMLDSLVSDTKFNVHFQNQWPVVLTKKDNLGSDMNDFIIDNDEW